MSITFSISCRSKSADEPVGDFLAEHFPEIPLTAMDSVFGFVEEKSTLYGGRQYVKPEFSDQDIAYLSEQGVGLKLPLTNHFVTREEYEENIPFLERYHHKGNAAVIVNDDLATWMKEDFPNYFLEASVIKEIDTHEGVAEAFKLYDTVVLPMRLNTDLEFLEAVENKDGIRLFSNGGCAYNCQLKICYKSLSKMNKYQGDTDFKCSQPLLYRPLFGMVDFDLERLSELGFKKFKALRSKGKTGY